MNAAMTFVRWVWVIGVLCGGMAWGQVVEKVPEFARDLVIASYYGVKDNPTVLVMNKKTWDRMTLKKGVALPSGLVMQSVSIGKSRADTTVEVVLKGETAVLRYDPVLTPFFVPSTPAKPVPKGPAKPVPPKDIPDGRDRDWGIESR